MEFLQKTLLFYCVIGFLVIPFVILPIVNANTFLVYGNFQLYLTQTDSIGIQHIRDISYFIELESLQANTLNCSAFIQQTEGNGVLSFTTDVGGGIYVLTNMNDVKVQINNVISSAIQTEQSFGFDSGDNIKIIWSISNPLYNFLIGLVGVALFIINPILSYKLSDNARDKFKFFFILIAVGFVALGLSLTFVYAR